VNVAVRLNSDNKRDAEGYVILGAKDALMYYFKVLKQHVQT